jgi:hypothetical protein
MNMQNTKASSITAKKRGAPRKKLTEYMISRDLPVVADGDITTDLNGYAACPAHAFLKQVCECEDAYTNCQNKFTKKKDGTYQKDSQDSLEILANALVVAIMGHFETYQKYLFGRCFEYTALFSEFDALTFFKQLKEKGISYDLDPARLAAYRLSAAPIGHLLADRLKVWHYPKQVNSLFQALCKCDDPFNTDSIAELDVLWQLRHSIAHTAGSLTLPDAQKVPLLSAFASRPIVFEPKAINAIARKLHRIVKSANHTIAKTFLARLRPDTEDPMKDEVKMLLEVRSPKGDPYLK